LGVDIRPGNIATRRWVMSSDKSDPKSKAEPSKKGTKISPADDLTKTRKSGDIELDEEELKRVSGGAAQEAMK
jgi:hypothetical protein